MADKHEDENFIRPCTIPASPNWYCSCAGGCSDNGKYVFGGKNYLFLTDLENLICDSKLTQGYFAAHKERVTAVCLLPDVKEPLEGEYWSLVASGSDDMLVRIWGCETGQKLREHKRHQGKIVAISCALKYPSIIVSGDDKGTIIFWNYVKGLFTQWTPERAEIFCLAASPHEEGVIAVGYGNGHVIVGNISKDEILQEYKSHLDEVHSVVWCPEPGDFLSTWRAELKGGGFLLASGSKDKTIKIWNILDDKPRCNLTLPPISKMPGQKGKRKGFDAQKVRVWMALCWVRETSLLSSSFTGDILAWDLKENDWHPISPGHIRTVFTISHDTRANKLVSTSIDRRIIFWDSNTYEKLDTLPSLGGFVYSATCSMVDPHAVAFGVGDNTIRIWNTRSKGKAYDITQVWQGLKSKITSVCFHPRKEGLLAYGTDDGHVGIYNAISQRIEFSSSYHKKTVYSLSWGPCCRNTSEGDDTGEELKASRLFSCGGEGIIYQHSVSNLKAPAEDINKLIVKANNLKGKTPSRSDVEWKPDLKVVAVGNDDGTIDILCAPQLVRLCIVHVHRKMINCLKWHPHFSLTETENDQHSCLLASGSGDNYVCVTDLGAVLSDMEPSELKITKKFRCFDGHLGRITGVCWNPHTVGMLASSSYDGTVQIWNVLENQLIGNFREHIGRVLCVLWSFLDTDVVYSGGEDNTLRRWKISDTLHKTPPEKKKPSGSQIAKRSVTEPDSNVSRPSSEEAVGDQINDAKYSKKIPKDDPVSQAAVVGTDNLKPESHIRPTNMSTSENAVLESDIPGSSSAEVKPDLSSVKSQGAEKVTSVKPTKSKGANWRRKGKEKPLLPLTGIANDKAKQPSQEECVLLAQYLSGKLKESSNVTASNFQPGTESHINLGLYTDRLSAFRMIDTEGKRHEEMGNTDNQIFLELWKGNLGSALKIAKEKEYLSETLVAMSVLGGYELYEETVQAYADQLASKEFYQTAATYYLAIHKVHEAIDMFRKQAMFKEAVALAKIRLAPNDPIINELQYAWGDKLLSEGSYEPAARCYLAAGREDDAIKVLAKKNDSNSLKTAARVALACDKDEKAESLSIQYAENLLLEMRWKEIHEFLTFSDKLQGTRFLSIVHELILQKLCKRQTLDPFKIPEIRKESHWAVHIDIDNLPDVLQKLKGSAGSQSHIQDKTNIVFHSSCIFWKAFGQMPSNLESYRTESNLNKASEIQMFVKSQKFPKVLLEISKLIANGILYILRGDSEKSFKCWLQAIHICSVAAENETVESLIQLCIPRWTLTVDSYLRFTETISASKRRYAANLLKNFNAFYMASALYKLWLSPDTEIESESNMNTSDLVQLNMETSNEIHEVKNQSEMDTAATDQDDRDSKIEDTSNSYAKLLTAMGQSGLNVKHKQDLLVTLSGISFSLLSDLDARVSVLKKQLEATEKELMEQEIKQRLKEHIESNRTKNTKSKPHMPNNDNIQSEKSDTPSSSSSAGVDSKLISRGDANGYDTSLTSLDDTSSEVAIVDSGVDVDEQTMMALLSKREAIKCELMHIPPEIKDYPFPSPLENAKIIICLCFRTENTGIPERRRQLESLAKDIAHWALRHATSVDESKYFVDVLSRIGEPGNE